MKRFAVILFTVFYASVSMGLDLNVHYCGGKLAKISIALPVSPCCCEKAMTDSDCCADAQISLEMNVDQLTASVPSLETTEDTALAFNTFEDFTKLLSCSEKAPHVLANPPPLPAQQLRILMGSLTFYG